MKLPENVMDEESSGAFEGTLDALSPVFQNYKRLTPSFNKVFEVHVAQRFGRYYAIKSLASKYKEDAFFKECLAKEFQIGVQLDHANIVRVHSIENDPVLGRCIVMDYIQGMQLNEWLATKPSKKLRKQVMDQIFSAISYCHSKQICHYDLKPSNILITENGQSVKIIDFGLADQDSYAILKHAAGTRQYAAPEQLQGCAMDLRTDIYALGGIIQILFPKRYRRAIRAAKSTDPKNRPLSVKELQRKMRPNWLIIPAIIAIISAFFLFMTPMDIQHSVTLDSGQKVYYKVLSHWKREVELVPPTAEVIYPTAVLKLYRIQTAGDLVIPSHIKHRFVKYKIKSVAANTFYSCKNLKHLSISEGIEHIGPSAFVHCAGLQDTLILPKSIKIIEGCAWANCYNLKTVILRGDFSRINNEQNYSYGSAFPRCDNLQNVIVDFGVHTVDGLFSNMSDLSSVSLPEGLTELGADAFSHNPKLQSITIPSTVKIIGWGTFYESGLKSIVIPNNVESIEPYAFAYCTSLESVTIGKKTTKISNYAFAEVSSLQEIVLLCEQPPVLEDLTFDKIPDGVTVRVPKGSVERYRSNAKWKKVGNIIENK